MQNNDRLGPGEERTSSRVCGVGLRDAGPLALKFHNTIVIELATDLPRPNGGWASAPLSLFMATNPLYIQWRHFCWVASSGHLVRTAFPLHHFHPFHSHTPSLSSHISSLLRSPFSHNFEKRNIPSSSGISHSSQGARFLPADS